jgi:hypothetical protein
MRYGPPSGFSILHHHLGYMLHTRLSSTDRKEFHECMSVPSLCDFLRYRGLPLTAGPAPGPGPGPGPGPAPGPLAAAPAAAAAAQ